MPKTKLALSPFLFAGLLLAADAACTSHDAPSDAYYDECTNSPTTSKAKRCTSAGDDDDVTTTSTSGSSSTSVDVAMFELAADARPMCMIVDDDTAYWIRDDGVIGAISTTNVPSVGSPVPTYASHRLVARSSEGQCGLVRDGEYLYATMFDAGAIVRLHVNKEGDGRLSFDDDGLVMPGVTTPSSIVVDDDFLYVTEFNSGMIRRLPKSDVRDGGSPDASSDAGVGGDAGSAGAQIAIVVGTEGTRANNLFTDGLSLFWSSFDAVTGSGIRKLPKAGGVAQTISMGDAKLHRVGSALYFLCDTAICSVPTAGGITTQLALVSTSSSTRIEVRAVASDGAQLFYATGTSVYRFNPQDTAKLLFGYTTSAGSPKMDLFVQSGRLTWALGTAIFTRSIPR